VAVEQPSDCVDEEGKTSMAVTGSTATATTTNNLFGVGGNSQPSKTTPGGNEIGMDGFLNMFMTQLKHQDPTNPLESYELSAQLAQFSSVEKLSQIKTNILKEIDYLTSISYGQMTQMIGKEVVGVDDSVQLHQGETSKSSYKLDVPANVTLKIFNDNESLVRTISLGKQDSGTYDVQWDGLDNSGKTATDGTYRVEVEAEDPEGNSLDVTQTVSGKVYAFRMDQNNPQLIVGGVNGARLALGSITEVRDGADAADD
jgi:flagellar basal-body rod modification protein FlgD